MRVGSLFTGYGGLDRAARAVFGGELAWVSDNHPSAVKLLQHRHPEVPNLGDITQIDWQEVRRMAWPRHDERACQMYKRYQQGLSLAEVAAEFGCTRQSVFGLFKTRGWELRPRPGARKTVRWNGKLYSLRNNGYYGCTTGDRHLMHRAVWEFHNGTIPPDYDIHHRDEDKTNNALSNLECLPKSEHTRLYSTRCNQYSHKCGCDQEVMPEEAPAIDVLTAGFPIRLARTSATLASAPASREHAVDSGPMSPTPFAYFDPDTLCWRTSQHSLFEDLTESSPTWPRSGMTSGGRAYELPTWAPRTDANAGSDTPLLGTPRCADGMSHPLRKGVGNPRGRLEDMVSLLPTPRATDTGTPGRRASEGFRPPLSQVINEKLLPTPTVHGNNNAVGMSPTSRDGLTTALRKWTGDSSGLPSTDGKTSSDDVHPNPLRPAAVIAES